MNRRGISMFLFFNDWWCCYAGTAAAGEPDGDEVSFADYVASRQYAVACAPGLTERCSKPDSVRA